MSHLFEARDSDGVKHELFTRNIQLPEDYGHFNCLAGTIAVAFNTLGRSDLSERSVLESLPIPFDLRYMCMVRMSEATQAIAQKSNISVYWYQREIKYNKVEFTRNVVEHLIKGDLIHLMVEGDRWTKNVYSINEHRGQNHAVLVVGFEKHDNIVEFNICDSMTASSRSLSVDKIFNSLSGTVLGKINEFIHLENIPLGIFEKA